MDEQQLSELLLNRVSYLHNTFDDVTREKYQKQIRIVFFDDVRFDNPKLYGYKEILVRQIGILYDVEDTVTRTDIEETIKQALNEAQ